MAEMVDVYLSPSLQEWNVGVGNYGTEEQRMNLLADVVQYELERHGLDVARNRPEMSLAEVVRESNAIGRRFTSPCIPMRQTGKPGVRRSMRIALAARAKLWPGISLNSWNL